MNEQLTHLQNKFAQKEFPLVLLLDHISSPANLGSIFRIADAFGVQKIYIHESVDVFTSNRFKRVARSTQNWIAYETFSDKIALVQKLVKDDFDIFALEITENSLPIHQIKFANKKICLVLGDEKYGVSQAILEKVNTACHIGMFGKNSSMNVSQATAIALYEITHQLTSI
ncbi:TrmH family RNA methyltransferase [Mesonia sp. K7]|uniref:TrmH family RNA methyltransferase n=1 Tax=Mesonia sp. K7 TaxID=2218606 RepID=UPI000DA86ECF|nr:TrmH family RNA methyltransferase [Mesonia sp. K7]PZD76840.1 TrmH family RNA methyltransferase [Mesonia sp. K7]